MFSEMCSRVVLASKEGFYSGFLRLARLAGERAVPKIEPRPWGRVYSWPPKDRGKRASLPRKTLWYDLKCLGVELSRCFLLYEPFIIVVCYVEPKTNRSYPESEQGDLEHFGKCAFGEYT